MSAALEKLKPLPSLKGAEPSWNTHKFKRRLSLPTPGGMRVKHDITVEHHEDPKAALFRKIGPLPDGIVQFSRILVAIYQPPRIEKTQGGVILTDKLSEDDYAEALWQGKVGLIVATGKQAYVDDDNVKFHNTKNEVGDWVWFRPSDGIGCEINQVFCRVLSESHIIGKIPHPDLVW